MLQKISCFKLFLLTLSICMFHCKSDSEGSAPSLNADGPKPAAPISKGFFQDIASSVGVDFSHDNGHRGYFYFPETVGSGVGLLDYDNDGDLDILAVQNAPFKGKPFSTNKGSRLFANKLLDKGQKGALGFEDVTDLAKLDIQGFGIGVATGDINNDGWIDIYITKFGANQMLLNKGDGSFEDISVQSQTNDERFGVSAAFLDYDRDGWLDLYVVNYVDFHPDIKINCSTDSGELDFCGPKAYKASPDKLFRNLGNGQFEDVTAISQIATAYGPGLGIVCGDWNNDGWPDIYIANDGSDNFYWVNQGNGRFQNDALFAGNATNANGVFEASMGIVAADFDGDSDEDLFMTHLLNETNTLYVNQGDGWFQDMTVSKGLARPSKGFTGFGTSALDVDRDGSLDLVIANGAVSLTGIALEDRKEKPFPYDQPNQLLLNNGSGQFENASAIAGADLVASKVSRGLASGDLDNDGDVDVVISNSGDRLQILDNQHPNQHHWLGVRAMVGPNQRDAIGATLTIELASGRTYMRAIRSGDSYASAQDPRIVFGLGKTATYQALHVRWLGGGCEMFNNLAIDTYHVLRQTQGIACPQKH